MEAGVSEGERENLRPVGLVLGLHSSPSISSTVSSLSRRLQPATSETPTPKSCTLPSTAHTRTHTHTHHATVS